MSRNESGQHRHAVSDTQEIIHTSNKNKLESSQVTVELQTQGREEREAAELEARSRAGSTSWQSRSVLEL